MKRILEKLLRKPIFSYREAVAVGVDQIAIEKLMAEDVLVRVAHGLYMNSKYDSGEREIQYMICSRLIGAPSAICLISALDYYGLTDEIPRKTWMMVDQNKRVQNSSIRLLRTRNPHWKVGIEQQKGEDWAITSLERTLVDCLIHHKIVGKGLGIQATKQALREKKTNLNSIIEVAKKMDVYERIYPTILVLSV